MLSFLRRFVPCEAKDVARPDYPTLAEERDRVAALIDGESEGGGASLLAWGFVTVVAVVLGFASWQYAPPRAVPTEVARADVSLPPADDITGSVATSERGQTTVTPSRIIGGGRVTPLPLGAGETVATSRDVDQLRAEIRDLQRRLAQVGNAGDTTTRRIDRLEEKMAGDLAAGREKLAALPPAPPQPTAPAATQTVAKSPEPAPAPLAEAQPAPPAPTPMERLAEAVRLPQPRPAADAPILTGTVPQKAAETPVEAAPAPKANRAPAPITPAPAPTAAATPAPETPPAVADPAPTAPRPATPAPGPGENAAAVDLGGYRTVASLKRSWSDMADRYAEFGGRIEPLARLRETESGMEARLVAGPYATQADAAKACLRLHTMGVTCAVTTWSGQPLASLR